MVRYPYISPTGAKFESVMFSLCFEVDTLRSACTVSVEPEVPCSCVCLIKFMILCYCRFLGPPPVFMLWACRGFWFGAVAFLCGVFLYFRSYQIQLVGPPLSCSSFGRDGFDNALNTHNPTVPQAMNSHKLVF